VYEQTPQRTDRQSDRQTSDRIVSSEHRSGETKKDFNYKKICYIYIYAQERKIDLQVNNYNMNIMVMTFDKFYNIETLFSVDFIF